MKSLSTALRLGAAALILSTPLAVSADPPPAAQDASPAGEVKTEGAAQGAPSSPRSGGKPPARRFDAEKVRERMLELDVDGDGSIEKSEYHGPRPEAFDEQDANKDGKLDAPEINALIEKMKERGEGARERFGDFARRRRGEPEGPGGPEGGPPGARLEGLDADKDGKISREEFKGPEEFFARLDANGDGAIDETERTRALDRMRERIGRGPGGPPGGRLEEMDADKDGKISREEFKGPEEFFARLDANGDGAVDEAEKKRAIDHARERFGRGPGPGGEGPGGPEGDGPRRRMRDRNDPDDPDGPGGREGGPDLAGRALKRLDKDKDGFLSVGEFKGNSAKLLERLDTDKDGKASLDELRDPKAEKILRRLTKSGDGPEKGKGKGKGGKNGPPAGGPPGPPPGGAPPAGPPPA